MRPRDPRVTQEMPRQETNTGISTARKGLLGMSAAALWVTALAVILVLVLVISIATGKLELKFPELFGGVKETRNEAAADDDEEAEAVVVTTAEESFTVNHAGGDETAVSFPTGLDFTNGILIDVKNGAVIASKGGEDLIYPASMTKIMTLIVAVENCPDLDEKFTMTAEITDPLYLANASVAGFKVGEEVTVRDLIYGLILPSGGDGALGLAYHIAGSEEAFAELMNKKAQELGLKNTHFTNCTGLHGEEHYSTCHEIAIILEYAIRDDFMREVLTTYQYTTEITPQNPDGILLTSTLLSRMNGDESGTVFVQGGKTGYTNEAKNCLATFATRLVPGMPEDELKRQETDYILVTAKSGEKFGPVYAAIEIYKAFATPVGADPSVDGTEGVTVAPPEESAAPPPDNDNAPAESSSVKIYTAA